MTEETSHLKAAVDALQTGQIKQARRLAHKAREAGEPGTGDFFEALRVVRENLNAVRKQPNSADAHRALGFAYFFADAGDAALQEADAALRLNPQAGEAYVLRGMEFSYRGERAVAEEAHAQANRLLAPDNILLTALGEILNPTEPPTEPAEPAEPPADAGEERDA